MIKKTIILILLVFPAVLPLFGQSVLVSAYKSGKIVLAPDPRFGRGVDWESVVLHFANDMTVAPDGSIFVANNRENTILKFDGDGRLIRKFGRKGQGPGDFEFPSNLSILDGRTLIVGEYAGNRRISLFDLEGGLIKLIRTNAPVFDIAALKESVIAYRSMSFGQTDTKPTGGVDHHQALIKDMVSGREVRVADAAIPYHGFSSGLRLDASVCGTLLVAATRDGDVLVCDTRKPEVEVFNFAGKKLRTFMLKLEPFPLTKEYLRRYKAEMIRGLRNGPAASLANFREIVREVEGASFGSLVDGHFPLYKNLVVDSEGNILVFKNTDCLGDCPILVQAYSPSGEFLAEFELDPGSFKVEIDHRFRNICFTGRGIFGMFPRKDDRDEIIVLTKAVLK
jgi:hypothetical protein